MSDVLCFVKSSYFRVRLKTNNLYLHSIFRCYINVGFFIFVHKGEARKTACRIGIQNNIYTICVYKTTCLNLVSHTILTHLLYATYIFFTFNIRFYFIWHCPSSNIIYGQNYSHFFTYLRYVSDMRSITVRYSSGDIPRIIYPIILVGCIAVRIYGLSSNDDMALKIAGPHIIDRLIVQCRHCRLPWAFRPWESISLCCK